LALRSTVAPANARAKGGVCKGAACLFALIVALAASVSRAHAEAATFVLASGQSKVQFVSDAPLERITGATSHVTGQIELDPAAPERAHAEIAVPVASIKTNNDLRDEHLRSDSWLDAKRFPSVHFALSSVSGVSAVPLDQPTSANVRGKLSVHGIVRELATTAKVRLSQVEGKRTLRVQASFPVALEAHEVSIPSLVKLKVAAVIQVHLDLYAHASAPVASTSERPAAAPTAATVEPQQARPAQEAITSSTPAKPAAKSRAQADGAGTRRHLPAADETPKPERLDAAQAERSDGRGADGSAASSAAPQASPPEPSASSAPSASVAAEDKARNTASHEQGCSAVSGTRSTWPLLLSAAWLLRRRRHARRRRG